jgi:hypothetical protein
VAGQTGPDSYDCAGLTSSAWNASGYSLATTVADQWKTGSPVAKEDVQVGDLAFFADAQSGLQHVGLYLGGGFVLDSSAAQYQVGVEQMSDDFYAAVRVTLPAPAKQNTLPASDGSVKKTCGAIEAPAGTVGSPQWGGYPNGMIPDGALCKFNGGQMLRCDAAGAFTAMSTAYQAQFGSPICITDSYRSFALQVTTYQRKPTMAAVPGTSNHGWALAVDLCGGIDSYGTSQYAWMKANAGRFGFVHPTWAEPGNGREEPWHWEFGRIS